MQTYSQTLHADGLHWSPETVPPAPRSWIGRMLARAMNQLHWTATQGLPLFGLELLIFSNRPRTYLIRSTFAAAIFFAALLYTSTQVGGNVLTSAARLPGQGRLILEALVTMLYGVVYVFAPAIASGAITLEKERQTLVLLFLSKLTPTHVVFEKYLSRLIPTLTLLLMSMPLLVFSYAFGGVNPEMLVTSLWFLSLSAVQVTAVALLCSSLCRQTTHAFALTYGALVLLYFGPAMVHALLQDPTLMYWSYQSTMTNELESPWLACFPAAQHMEYFARAMSVGKFEWSSMLVAGYPSLLSALCSLVIARGFVFHRAFDEKRSYFLNSWKWFRRTVLRSEESLVQRSLRVRHIPENYPIAWRESVRSVGNWLPLTLLLEIPTILLLFWMVRTYPDTPNLFSPLIGLFWMFSVVMICLYNSTLMTRERAQQTLDLLLITPISSQDIVQQKFNGTRRLMLISAAPLITTILFQAWWRSLQSPSPADALNLNFPRWAEYLISSLACVFIYLQLVGWISLWAGLKSKSPTHATLSALGSVMFCCVVPQIFLSIPLAIIIPVSLTFKINLIWMAVVQLSPVIMIGALEVADLYELSPIPLLPSILNCLIYGSLLLYARRYVLDRADQLLGRIVYY